MAQVPVLPDLLARLRDGDDAAASALYHHFAQRLIVLARCRLDLRVQQKVDAEEVVQSVFKSFFPRHAGGQYDGYDLHSGDNLWGLLVRITLRKCSRKIEHFLGPHHDVRKEVVPPDASDSSWHVQASDPTPDEAAQMADLVEQVMRDLIPTERQVVQLRLQGYTVAEIAREIDRTEYTVKWILKRLRKKLHWMLEPDTEQD